MRRDGGICPSADGIRHHSVYDSPRLAFWTYALLLRQRGAYRAAQISANAGFPRPVVIYVGDAPDALGLAEIQPARSAHRVGSAIIAGVDRRAIVYDAGCIARARRGGVRRNNASIRPRYHRVDRRRRCPGLAPLPSHQARGSLEFRTPLQTPR